MKASKVLVTLIKQKQTENNELSHDDAYKLISVEKPEAIENFLIELGINTSTPIDRDAVNAVGSKPSHIKSGK